MTTVPPSPTQQEDARPGDLDAALRRWSSPEWDEIRRAAYSALVDIDPSSDLPRSGRRG